MILKNLTITVVAWCICMATFSQDIQYTYDAAGNRVKRKLAGVCKTDPNTGGETAPATDEEPQISDEEPNADSREALLVFPNPTTGKFDVQIDMASINAAPEITLYDNSGRLLWKQKFNKTQITIDLSDYAKGPYLLHVETEQEIYRRRILKQ